MTEDFILGFLVLVPMTSIDGITNISRPIEAEAEITQP